MNYIVALFISLTTHLQKNNKHRRELFLVVSGSGREAGREEGGAENTPRCLRSKTEIDDTYGALSRDSNGFVNHGPEKVDYCVHHKNRALE